VLSATQPLVRDARAADECDRLFRRARRNHVSDWYVSSRTPASRNVASAEPDNRELPIASTTTVTVTLFRARSASAPMKRSPTSPGSKM
jgi:hypothetical protein